MKIAVVYSGEPRSFAKVKYQHFKFFYGVEYDTLHSTWTKTSPKEQGIIASTPHIKKFALVDYNIPGHNHLIRFEKTLLATKRDHPIFMLGRIQYMTSCALNISWNELFQYDLIVRMRYDFEYEGRFLDLLPKTIEPNDIFTTRKMGGKSHPHNVWDGFAFGTPFVMSLYFDFHRWLPFSLYNQDIVNWKFQPEYVYGKYLRMLDLNVRDCGVQPVHIYPDGKDVNWHRTERTVQYYRDLATYHSEFYTHTNNKLTILNDSPVVSDEYIIDRLNQEGFKCNEVQ